jgi:hypothetical protein
MAQTTTGEGQEAFRTHHNYIRSLRQLMEGSALSHMDVKRITPAPIPLLDAKRNLIDLTKKSLNDEANIVRKDQDYSYASTSWLPVKTYYLLFNIMMTVEYLFTLDPSSFKIGHATCSAKFTTRLASGVITFSEPKLNVVYDRLIFSYHEPTGANLRSPSLQYPSIMLALKKIAQYKLEDWKRSNKIPSFALQKHRLEKEAFMGRFKMSIFDFPYHMRLRASYRDFAFIEGVSSADTAAYFNDYFAFSRCFYRALQGLRDQLVRARTA